MDGLIITASLDGPCVITPVQPQDGTAPELGPFILKRVVVLKLLANRERDQQKRSNNHEFGR